MIEVDFYLTKSFKKFKKVKVFIFLNLLGFFLLFSNEAFSYEKDSGKNANKIQNIKKSLVKEEVELKELNSDKQEENKQTANIEEQEERPFLSKENKEKLIDQAPFLKKFIWNDEFKNEKAPYNHYIAVAFSAFDIRDNKHPFYWFNMQYGQYNELFRIPGRFSFNLGMFGGNTLMGDRHTYENILSFYLGVMYEFIFTFKYFYITTGVGAYIRDKRDDKIGSNFVFGPKIAIGKTFYNKVDVELIYQHFSNGYLAMPNRGINLLALQVGFRF